MSLWRGGHGCKITNISGNGKENRRFFDEKDKRCRNYCHTDDTDFTEKTIKSYGKRY